MHLSEYARTEIGNAGNWLPCEFMWESIMMIDALLDMTFGMILGMIASPLMMKGIKVIRQRRKVDRILREILQDREINLTKWTRKE